ncbi:MAG: hypothetical protein A2651_00435 [Candidatus Yanofskybacteria bacterium RIFCSPHIGHO2_01_FULL_42_12]|uniref:Uncharacterized protein n=1 Tax=Candidatus Yanofskybacteria bacterium RIFCSPLOWO2_01_FULL_42_49 TaxID=1802694 RepID=A0A1F8GAV9_9BACT|nr:MAG: hypothetical protein A2651_00435 [Candidatus Yanofskybacteria bacterium RIFCSPHIGHO2_01_FULL_42_12]OGN22170.1 MAG: hypothetical protein A2918_03355 [Candidatus Yanofskybacteria bacterium RIFCSPLOWO2_01_FULL_42_49]
MIIIVIVLLIIPFNTHAYLDPGTGSFIIQIIIATMAGFLFSTKIYWTKFKSKIQHFQNKFFKRNKDGER